MNTTSAKRRKGPLSWTSNFVCCLWFYISWYRTLDSEKKLLCLKRYLSRKKNQQFLFSVGVRQCYTYTWVNISIIFILFYKSWWNIVFIKVQMLLFFFSLCPERKFWHCFPKTLKCAYISSYMLGSYLPPEKKWDFYCGWFKLVKQTI